MSGIKQRFAMPEPTLLAMAPMGDGHDIAVVQSSEANCSDA